jgi:hypothetical protein
MTAEQTRKAALAASQEAQARAKRENAKHTPGPWELWTSCSWRRFCTADGAPVAVPTIVRDGHPDLQVSAEDARLIIAAPELLQAVVAARAEIWRLLDVKGIPPKDARGWPEIVLCEAAIRKATRDTT